MKNVSIKSIKQTTTTLVVYVVLVLLLCISQVAAQTICTSPSGWTISIVRTTDGIKCGTNGCNSGQPQHNCDSCFEVTITNVSCNQPIDYVTISSNGNNSDDCHSTCSPNGDFTPEPTPDPTICSWHTPSILYVTNPSGIITLASGKFRVCNSVRGFQYTIKVHFKTPNMCTNSDAVICF